MPKPTVKRSIYIAGPWIHKDRALLAQHQFEAAGHEVVSRWITKHTDVDDENDPKHFTELRKQAEEDLQDLAKADNFVILNTHKSEGKATELGYAIAMKEVRGFLDIYLVGDTSINIFYHLPDIHKCQSIEEVIECLK